MARAAGVSRSTIPRIWAAHGLQPHGITTFKLSKDPGVHREADRRRRPPLQRVEGPRRRFVRRARRPVLRWDWQPTRPTASPRAPRTAKPLRRATSKLSFRLFALLAEGRGGSSYQFLCKTGKTPCHMTEQAGIPGSVTANSGSDRGGATLDKQQLSMMARTDTGPRGNRHERPRRVRAHPGVVVRRHARRYSLAGGLGPDRRGLRLDGQ